MRIALFTIDSLASNRAVQAFIRSHHSQIALVGLSSRPGKGLLSEGWRHFSRSGVHFCAFMFVNFVLPRWVGSVSALQRRVGRPYRQSIAGLCQSLGLACAPMVDVNGPETHKLLRERKIDLIVSCYFDQIFKATTIAAAPLGIINVHTAMLPYHRGPIPVLYGWLDEPPSLGVTLHTVDEQIDTGPILAQKSYAAAPGDTILRIMSELHERGLELLATWLGPIEQGTIQVRAQVNGSYESYPSRAVMQNLRERGGRLVDARDVRSAWNTPIDY